MSAGSDDWDGPDGMRKNGIGRIDRNYRFDETNLWMRQLGLPEMRLGETYVDWDKRVSGLRDVAKLATDQVLELKEE